VALALQAIGLRDHEVVQIPEAIPIAWPASPLRRFTALAAVDADASSWGAVERARLVKGENYLKLHPFSAG
jgi:hypothetical protein